LHTASSVEIMLGRGSGLSPWPEHKHTSWDGPLLAVLQELSSLAVPYFAILGSWIKVLVAVGVVMVGSR
jgi:hypothetical protein